ncbi:MAG: TetR/AcrR family transcriptional regulator [Candidatus Dormibacteraeota bacterium]|nr:TetR/AcrR family transcriptional regulator [Candidatus Dormibacteraeota bacterium]
MSSSRSRRRGKQLANAIYDAVLTWIKLDGFDALTMEGIAARARTGKSALYRRWSSKEELVLDALLHRLPELDAEPDTGTVRDDVLEHLGCMVDTMKTPAGQAMWTILHNPSSGRAIVEAIDGRVIEPHQRTMLKILRRGVARGEVRPDAVNRLVAQVGPLLIRQHHVAAGLPSNADVVQIVDQVVVPMLRP